MVFTRAITVALATALSISTIVQAVPVKRAQGDINGEFSIDILHTFKRYLRLCTIIDMDILNFALTLEHLEVAFYTQGLNKFNATDFKQRVFRTLHAGGSRRSSRTSRRTSTRSLLRSARMRRTPASTTCMPQFRFSLSPIILAKFCF